MKFLSLFNEIEKGSYGLTDEAVYASIQNQDEMIPLWGGNKEHKTYERKVSVTAKTIKGKPIKIFSGSGIIISLDGSAGCMTYKCNEKFALNHHAGFITVRDTPVQQTNLEYFALFYQNFYRSLAVSDGSKTLSLEQIYAEEFEIPPLDTQNEVMERILTLTKKIDSINDIKSRLEGLLTKELTEYSKDH